MLAWPGADGPDQIIDDGGDATMLIHKGKEFEEKFAKDASLPDPNSTTSQTQMSPGAATKLGDLKSAVALLRLWRTLALTSLLWMASGLLRGLMPRKTSKGMCAPLGNKLHRDQTDMVLHYSAWPQEKPSSPARATLPPNAPLRSLSPPALHAHVHATGAH